jgi:hypothetical protein
MLSSVGVASNADCHGQARRAAPRLPSGNDGA